MPVSIQHPSSHDDALAQRLSRMLEGEIAIVRLNIGMCPKTGPVSSERVCGRKINGCEGARNLVERYAG